MLAGTINDLSAKILFYFILFHIIYIYIYFLVGGVIVCTYNKLSVRLEVYFCSFFPPPLSCLTSSTYSDQHT